MSNPKNEKPSKTVTARAAGQKPTNYVGSALTKQEPERKLTRAQQMQAASDAVIKAMENFASLLSGEHVTLPMMQAGYYIIDKLWKKPIDDMRKMVNTALKEHMREHEVERDGQRVKEPLTELVLDYGGETYKAEREVQRHKMGNAPGMADVKQLAEKLGVDWLKLCNPVTTYEYNEQMTIAIIKEKMPKADPAKVIDEARLQKSESLSIEKV
jgi:hypothetical protein